MRDTLTQEPFSDLKRTRETFIERDALRLAGKAKNAKLRVAC